MSWISVPHLLIPSVCWQENECKFPRNVFLWSRDPDDTNTRGSQSDRSWHALPHLAVQASTCVSEKGKLAIRPGVSLSILPCCGSFLGQNNNSNNKQTNKTIYVSVLLCLFVLLLALLFVQNVSLSWWMYCAVTTYLPALVWICCFYVFVFFFFGGIGQGSRVLGLGRDGEGTESPGLRVKKKSLEFTM